MARFLVVPQWQGSSSSRAMQLVDGANAIAGDLPRAATTMVDVPLEAGDAQGSPVQRLSAIVRVRDELERAVKDAGTAAVTVGGDCGVALGAVAAVAADDLAVVWLDAHADLNSPATSPSGAFHGMVLRAIAGDGERATTLRPGIPPSRIVLAGTRALDPEEERYIADAGIAMLSPDDLADADALADAVVATGAARVYIHVDLDVLDPSEIAGLGHPEPFGVSVATLVAAVARLRARVPMAGATLTEFSPASPGAAVDDLGAILRIVGALA